MNFSRNIVDNDRVLLMRTVRECKFEDVHPASRVSYCKRVRRALSKPTTAGFSVSNSRKVYSQWTCAVRAQSSRKNIWLG